eukprot:CAMPEP_0179165686 /NCGR_PEP_ID=MMETSP0796-20121207/81381_1 /TAXON_ID=73915 /ORGANISM="Pyrodinium bahamense, Strain pbaha01" /LENGTH=228 /DNA_ID=CAMNT_0020868251 /DNA_START=12 /DNA_END=694 /DNA_ORIENTATION=-
MASALTGALAHLGAEPEETAEVHRQALDRVFSEGQDGEDEGTDSEDDFVGFQTLKGGDPWDNSKKPVGIQQDRRQARVVNLIDLRECDIPDEQQPPSTLPVPAVDAAAPAAPLQLAALTPEEVPLSMPGGQLNSGLSSEERLLAEIQLLQQRLQDSDAERSVQVSIVQDEVSEKERIIEELQCQRAAAEASLAMREERDAAAKAAEQAAARAVAEAQSAAEAQAAAQA